MKNRVEVAGYAAFGVGLLVTASLISPGFTADALPVAITVGLGAFAVGLVCLGVSAVWSRLPPAAPAVPPAGSIRNPDPQTAFLEDATGPRTPTGTGKTARGQTVTNILYKKP